MAAELRGGLSFGISGFSFWSHDIGGFTQSTPDDLYRRWTAFGMFSSHTRSHGIPPKEAWEYGEDFMNYFRKAVEMRYKLMPYIYAQAKESSEKGLPVLRALFIEFPDDPGVWTVEDEYMFGSDILVAPMLESGLERNVYLPGDKWIDYQTGKTYSAGWHNIKTGEIKAVILVRDGAVIPHIKLAQSTMQMDWTKLDLIAYTAGNEKVTGKICLPEDNLLHEIILTKKDGSFVLSNDPYAGKVKWTIK
jgi:alpha-D-xyloside xylohydrolase